MLDAIFGPSQRHVAPSYVTHVIAKPNNASKIRLGSVLRSLLSGLVIVLCGGRSRGKNDWEVERLIQVDWNSRYRMQSELLRFPRATSHDVSLRPTSERPKDILLQAMHAPLTELNAGTIPGQKGWSWWGMYTLVAEGVTRCGKNDCEVERQVTSIDTSDITSIDTSGTELHQATPLSSCYWSRSF